jgi:hypothetical protein
MARTIERRWKVGDSGWEVEWCTDLPEHPDAPGEADWDRATYEFRDFRDKAAAEAFAREVYPKCKIGSVRITPFTNAISTDPSYRKYTADSGFYEGED